MKDEVFEKTLQFVLQKEGGYVNDPHDLGGETNKGITHQTYNSYRKSKNLPIQSVKYISDDEVKDIYYNNYYKASGADQISDPQLSAYTFDTAVNMGVSRAKTFLKNSNGNPEIFEKLRRDKYEEFVKAKPDQKKYLQGWNNRVNDLKEFSIKNFSKNASDETLTLQGGIEKTNYIDFFKNNFIKKITGQAAPIDNTSQPFTRQQIGAMTPDEFTKNEPQIMQQLQMGQIKSQAPDFSAVKNSGRIFTREDIGNMSPDEYTQNEPQIMQQLKSVGIPANKQIQTNPNVVFVQPYTRADGTEVKGYYKAK